MSLPINSRLRRWLMSNSALVVQLPKQKQFSSHFQLSNDRKRVRVSNLLVRIHFNKMLQLSFKTVLK